MLKKTYRIIDLLERWLAKLNGYIPPVIPLYLAVGNNTASWSPDGTTWTNVVPAANLNWVSLAYGYVNNYAQVVAIANNASTANAVMKTNDGKNWNRCTAPSGTWNSVCYGNGLFVAVGNNSIMTSSNGGSTWTSQTSPANWNWQTVAYGNGVFVAMSVRDVASAKIYFAVSSDGKNWVVNNVSAGATTQSHQQFSFVNNLFLAYSGGGIFSSSGGTSWASTVTNITLNTVSGSPIGIVYAFSKYLFVQTAPNRIYTATTLSTWTSALTANVNNICLGNNLLVAVGANLAYTSTDASTFTLRTLSGTYNTVIYKAT